MHYELINMIYSSSSGSSISISLYFTIHVFLWYVICMKLILKCKKNQYGSSIISTGLVEGFIGQVPIQAPCKLKSTFQFDDRKNSNFYKPRP